MAAGAVDAVAKGIDALAELEKEHPEITQLVENRVNSAIADKLNPKQRHLIAVVGGAVTTVLTAVLIFFGHPTQAVELGTILSGITIFGHGVYNSRAPAAKS